MIIKVNDSSLCLHYLDGFRFQVGGKEYCVLLDTTDIDLYQYEIWKKDGNNLMSIPWWRSHPIHKNRATESIWTEPCNPLLRAAKSTKRATFNL